MLSVPKDVANIVHSAVESQCCVVHDPLVVYSSLLGHDHLEIDRDVHRRW